MKRSYFSLLLLPLLFTACGNNSPAPGGVVISSVTLENSPTKENYTVGEYFEPSGLSVKVTKSDESFYMISYLGNEEEFSFSPSLTTPLTAEIVNVVGTYESKEFLIPVTVSEVATQTVTMDFTVKHSVDSSGLPTQSNTGDEDKFAQVIDHYYLASEDISLESFEGDYIQLQNGHDVTATRSVAQMLIFGTRTYDVDVTFTFSKTVKSITFVCEAYSKYVSTEYYTNHNVDYDTYLEVNGDKKDIAGHKQEDIDETQSLKYAVNSSDVHMVCPQPDKDDPNKMAMRIMVYQIVLEF